ncbi:MAG: Asp-tRNA(Asn)/Glu-tRNA(Gln) amidotransferase subunit GatB [Saprospiraceae bacterium]
MYETVIGLETHVQLATRSKIFCSDDAAFGGDPNTHVSAVSLAHPGTLPRLNKQAVEFAARLGLALGCRVNLFSAFDRKNYFYADLPKGFQTTQNDHPICTGGAVQLPDGHTVRLHHIHLEEDAGKSLHDQDPRDSLIDLNRAGVPLLEIVSEPDLRSGEQVTAYMESLRRLVRWLGISDGNMEEGSLRCDVNISVRPVGSKKLGQRCEIKNVNSMRFARKAIEYEANRQIEILKSGGRIEQETRGFDPATGTTFSLREKEDAHDYRYFPEPDLPPVRLTPAFLERVKSEMPPLPQVLEQEFSEKLGLPADAAALLTQERETAEYFQKIVAEAPANLLRPAANLVVNRLLPLANSTGKPLTALPVSIGQILDFLQLIESGKLSASTANQRLWPALLERPGSQPAALAAEMNLLQTADADFLDGLADEVLAKYPDKVREYQKGKRGLIGFFMGELMKASRGKADPQAATQVLQKKLG